jgi:N6-adenosine-specific RNA methylase IME4
VRERLLRPGSGLLAVWVTNKPALRAGLHRLLDEEWGCEEVAEWVWVKVTVAGEPVYALESAVRKPYEVLIIARRRREGGEGRGMKRKRDEVKNGGLVAREEVTIPSKVVLAVPDVHSRKPCIKGLSPSLPGRRKREVALTGPAELIEPYLPASYSACEIFGRNLTEGWHTIGDEAIKYNWDGHWGSADEMGA